MINERRPAHYANQFRRAVRGSLTALRNHPHLHLHSAQLNYVVVCICFLSAVLRCCRANAPPSLADARARARVDVISDSELIPSRRGLGRAGCVPAVHLRFVARSSCPRVRAQSYIMLCVLCCTLFMRKQNACMAGAPVVGVVRIAYVRR